MSDPKKELQNQLTPQAQEKIKEFKNLLSFAKSKMNKPVFKKSYSDMPSLAPFIKVLVKFPVVGSELLDSGALEFFEIPYNNIISFEIEDEKTTKSTLVLQDITGVFISSIFAYLRNLTNGGYPIFNISFGWVNTSAPFYKKSESKPIREANNDYTVSTYSVSVESSKEVWTINLMKIKIGNNLTSTGMENFNPSNIEADLIKPFLISRACLMFNMSYSQKGNYGMIIKDPPKQSRINKKEWDEIINFLNQNEVSGLAYPGFLSDKDFNLQQVVLRLVNNSPLRVTNFEDDYISTSSNIPKYFITRSSTIGAEPLYLFNYLCRRMLNQHESIQSSSSFKGKISFVSLIDLDQFEESRIGNQKLLLKDFNDVKSKGWEQLLNEVCSKIKLVKKGNQTKTSNGKGDITLKITTKYIDKNGFLDSKIQLIKDYLDCFVITEDNNVSYKNLINKIKKELDEFKTDSSLNYINLIFIFPNFSELNIIDFLDIFEKTPNIIHQKYTVNPYKKIGSSFFNSSTTLSEENFPDVISFKPSYSPNQELLSSKVKSEATSGKTEGSVSSLTISFTKEVAMKTFLPLNTLISHSYSLYSTSNNYGSNFENFIEAKDTFLKNFRMSGVLLKAELVIFGEPFFSQVPGGGIVNLWIDVFSYDGSQTIYSGIYTVQSIKQNVTLSKFTTTLSLMRNFSTDENDNIPVPRAQVFIKEKEVKEVKEKEPAKLNEPGIISKGFASLKSIGQSIVSGTSTAIGNTIGTISGIGSNIGNRINIDGHLKYGGESIKGWINELTKEAEKEKPGDIKEVIITSNEKIEPKENNKESSIGNKKNNSSIIPAKNTTEKPKQKIDLIREKINKSASFNERTNAAYAFANKYPAGTKVDVTEFFTNEELKKRSTPRVIISSPFYRDK